MCWNCGCMMPDDDHGSPDNITTETLRRAGRAAGPDTVQKIMGNMNAIYDQKIKGTAADTEKV